MVEGNTDVAYLNHADKLYCACSGLSLLAGISVFSPGAGDDGGTPGILEQFPTLFNLVIQNNRQEATTRVRAVALLDDDTPGRSAFNLLRTFNRTIKAWQDVFLLKRNYP